MKRYRKSIFAANTLQSYDMSPDDVVKLLSEIEELKGIDVKVNYPKSGGILFTVGNNNYEVSTSPETAIMP